MIIKFNYSIINFMILEYRIVFYFFINFNHLRNSFLFWMKFNIYILSYFTSKLKYDINEILKKEKKKHNRYLIVLNFSKKFNMKGGECKF